MRCTYCETEITQYPDNGICPSCGGSLPPRPAGKRCPHCGNYSTGNYCSSCGQSLDDTVPPKAVQMPPQSSPIQNVYVSVPQPQPVFVPGGICCPKCGNSHVVRVRRGFSWGWGIIGFFLLPVVGILLGFSGRRKPRLKCTGCGHKWKL